MNEDDFDLDELLDIASTQDDSKDLHEDLNDIYHIEVRKFIRAKNIQEHNKPIPFKVIYDVYSQWSEVPMSTTMFLKYFRLYHKQFICNAEKAFKVRPESFNLPDYYSIYRDRRFNVKAKKTTNYKGVWTGYSFYIARLLLEGNYHYLGQFKTDKEAAFEYDLNAYDYLGELADLNFPEKVKEYEKEIEKRKTKKD